MEEGKKEEEEEESESWRKKKRRRWNESISGKVGDKERKEGGDEIRTNVYGGKKNKKTKTNKQTYGWNEMREKRNKIKNKKS